MTQKRYPELLDTTPEGLAEWIREVTRIREEDIGNADKVQQTLETSQGAISGATLTAVTVATDDKVLIQDTSDSNNLKTVTTQALANLAVVSDASITTSDITTNDSSTSKHGFLKKLDNTATHYMDGTGAWSTPAGTDSFALTSLSSGSIGSSTTLDVTSISGAYDALLVTFTGLSSGTANRALQVQPGVANTFGLGLVDGFQINSGGTLTQKNGTNMFITGTNNGVATETISGQIRIDNYASTSVFKQFYLTQDGSTNGPEVAFGMISTLSAINAIEFYWSGSGNFDAGTYNIYGINYG